MLEKAQQISKENGVVEDSIEVKIVAAMKKRFTTKVSNIKPLDAPIGLPPKGPAPPPPAPISYQEMLEKAKEAEMENKIS